jgi:hypothetical protein
LKRVQKEICQTLPPIAGVPNGALILRDQVFANMKLETFQTVVKPKVDGTIYLSQVFEQNTLDFFIAFSSIIATIGSIGQSSYSAANCFVKALIAQRRQRGLAGSVIDISRVVGVGYVEREAKAAGKLSDKELARLSNVAIPMSEPGLHQLFAEAIIAGTPGSGLKSDIISGLRTLTLDESKDVHWAAQVEFSHFIQDRGHAGAQMAVSRPKYLSKLFCWPQKVLKVWSEYCKVRFTFHDPSF